VIDGYDMGRFELLFILFLVTLEFWRFIFWKNLKLPHDEFLYDESFNSYHSHIYMLAKIGKPAHRLLALCWIWSTRVRPLLRGWSCSQDQDNLHPHISCCSYPGSTQKHVFSTQNSISYIRRGSKKIVRFLNKCSKIVIYLFSKFILK
jgi:hypothetical protein